MARTDTAAPAPTPGVVPDRPDLTTNAVQPQMMQPVRDMGEITPAPMGVGNAKMPVSAPQPGVAIPRGGMAEHVMNTFIGAGLPTTVAQGILMNINSESGINPAAVGDNGNSYGFVQLHKDRRDAYMAAAQAAGVDPADPTFQSNYIVNDLMNNYPQVYEAMLNAPDAGTAAVIFMDGYERPAKAYRDQRAMQYTGGNMPISDVGLGGANTSTASMPGVNPAYADRNALGQIFYNPQTNRLDKNAMLALLGGIGTMASSPSRFLGSAILQGMGGFANTYAGLQKDQADIARSRAETAASLAGTARALPGDVAAWAAMGSPVENADYAKMIGFPGAVPNAAPVAAPVPGTATGTAGMSTPDMIRAFQSGVVGENGIPLNQDPAFLTAFISRLAPVAGTNPNLSGVLAAAQNSLNNIQTTGVSYGAEPGSAVVNPSIAGATDTRSVQEANRLAAAEFRGNTPEVMDASGRQLSAVSQMKGVYQNMEPGALAGAGAQTAALLGAMDPDNKLGWKSYDLTDPAQYQIALKGTGEIMAARLAGLPGGAPAASIEFLQNITPGPDMQPGAIKKLLAIAEAEARYNMDLYNSYDPSRDGMDIIGYTKRFADNGNTFQKYVEDAYSKMPAFKGEQQPGQVAEGSVSVASDGKPIIFRNGKWEYQ